MRYLILSDIHANLDAFETVLEHAAGRWDRVLVLGDLVGYGAEPNEVVDRVKELAPDVVIRGNHDKAACGIDDGSQFNHVARMAAVWTGGQLTPENLAYLRELPMGPIEIDDLTEICHGAPFDEDAYVFDELDALRALKLSERPLCLFGHTHYPVTFELSAETFDSIGPSPSAETTLRLREGAKYLVNPGSVGQPRDGDPRAAYAVVDVGARSVELFRVPYRIEAAQAKIMKAGLPEVLAQRLAVGR